MVFLQKKFSREFILSQFTQGHIHEDVYSLIFISISIFSSISGLWSGSILSASRASPCSVQRSHLKCVRNISNDLSAHVSIVDQCYTREGGQSLRLRKEVV